VPSYFSTTTIYDDPDSRREANQETRFYPVKLTDILSHLADIGNIYSTSFYNEWTLSAKIKTQDNITITYLPPIRIGIERPMKRSSGYKNIHMACISTAEETQQSIEFEPFRVPAEAI